MRSAHDYIDGKSVPQNTEEGVRWLERAAEVRDRASAISASAGFTRRASASRRTSTSRAAITSPPPKRATPRRCTISPCCYAEGIDGKPDYKTAAEWFRRAAEFGVADSQYNLGSCSPAASAWSRTSPESYKWFALAAIQGDQDAAKKRDDVGAKLDAASLASARAAVQSFTAQPQPDDAISVQTPPGGWDKPAAENAQSRSRGPAVSHASPLLNADLRRAVSAHILFDLIRASLYG